MLQYVNLGEPIQINTAIQVLWKALRFQCKMTLIQERILNTKKNHLKRVGKPRKDRTNPDKQRKTKPTKREKKDKYMRTTLIKLE